MFRISSFEFRVSQAASTIKPVSSRRGAVFLFLIIFLADQFSKRLILYLFPGWIRVNTGMAWGLFTGRNEWWVGLSCLLLGVLLFLAPKMQKRRWVVAMILGGGVSNFVDRLVYGGVRDWLRVGWLPAFNLADLAIVLGVIFFGFGSTLGSGSLWPRLSKFETRSTKFEMVRLRSPSLRELLESERPQSRRPEGSSEPKA